jgi:hypothetical protein
VCVLAGRDMSAEEGGRDERLHLQEGVVFVGGHHRRGVVGGGVCGVQGARATMCPRDSQLWERRAMG